MADIEKNLYRKMRENVQRARAGTPYQESKPPVVPPGFVTAIEKHGNWVTLKPVYFVSKGETGWNVHVWRTVNLPPTIVWIGFSQILAAQRPGIAEQTFGKLTLRQGVAKAKGLIP